MAKNTKQIALIQHRRGNISELPKELHEGELGFATDTNQLFIGNSSNKSLADRITSNTFPFGNVEIFTESTDLNEKFRYVYKSNTDITAKLPIIISGTVASPTLPSGVCISFNGTEVTFTSQSDTVSLTEIVDTINASNSNVKAYKLNNIFLGLISTNPTVSLEDIQTSGNISNLKRLGISEYSSYIEAGLPLETRQLSTVVDERCSVLNFGASISNEDNSKAFYNAAITCNNVGQQTKFPRKVFIPCGTYKISSKVIPLPEGLYFKGEGIGRSIIKQVTKSFTPFESMDNNFVVSSNTSYKGNEIKNITFEDLTIDVSSALAPAIINLSATHNVTFRNVEFIGNTGSNHIVLNNSLSENYNLYFEHCIFNTGNIGIKVVGNVEHLIVKNCIFKNFTTYGIKFENNDSENKNIIIDGNEFIECTNGISLSSNVHSTSVVNNKFNDIEYAHKLVSLSTDSYTDILDDNEDERKVLTFKYTQPVWKYINSLVSDRGDFVLKTYIANSDISSLVTNFLYINPGFNSNDDTVSIYAFNDDGDLNIDAGNNGSLHLGKSLQTPTSANAKIYLHKDLDTYESYITSSSSDKNVKFKTETNGVITINTETTIENYNGIAFQTPNAIPTVRMIQNLGSREFSQIDYKALLDEKSSSMTLMSFDKTIYGSDIHLSSININIRSPFYTLQDRIANARDWVAGLTYYAGDVVKYTWSEEGTSIVQYYSALDKHVASEPFEDELNTKGLWADIYTSHICTDGETKLIPDAKYIEIIAEKLTPDGVNDKMLLFKRNDVKISERQNNGWYYSAWTNNATYSINDKVSYNGNYWKCIQTHTSSSEDELHNVTLWKQIIDEGNYYIFNFDRNLIPLDSNEIETDLDNSITSFNFAGYKLVLKFLDENLNIVPILYFEQGEEETEENHIQVSPNGFMSIVIDYKK